MTVLELKHEVVKEFIEKLERRGQSKDYVDGALEGMSFVLEFYQSMVALNKMKYRLLKEEQDVTS